MRYSWVVFTSRSPGKAIGDASFTLAGWGDDERIEYLLATNPERCQSVIVRLGNAQDRWAVSDTPRLWRFVLDEMAEHEAIRSVDDALWRRIERVFPKKIIAAWPRNSAWPFWYRTATMPKASRELLRDRSAETLKLGWSLRAVTLLAADYLARWLETSQPGATLLAARNSLLANVKAALLRAITPRETSRLVFPRDVVAKTAQQIAGSPRRLRDSGNSVGGRFSAPALGRKRAARLEHRLDS